MRIPLLLAALTTTSLIHGQTFFYLSGINVYPAVPSTSDEISLELTGDLSSTGAYIVSVGAAVTGNLVSITLVAADNGGLTVLVPYTETIALGELPAGDYTVTFSLNSVGLLDSAPVEDHFFTVAGGSPCDNLNIASVQWCAFSDTAIVVHAQNNDQSGAIFDYPNFILFDTNGDTLAKETVNFFGIGLESWHVLHVLPGAQIPTTAFPGTLELWRGFTTELACSWDMTFDLCPDSCAAFMPSMGNYGGALVLGTFDWEVWDGDGNPVSTGQFEFTTEVQYTSDTLCLPPGQYSFQVNPTGPSTGGVPMFYVTDESGQTSASAPVQWSLPVSLPVPFYMPCADGLNGIPEGDEAGMSMRVTADGVWIARLNGAALGDVALFSINGQLISMSAQRSNRAFIRLPSNGVFIVRAGAEVLKAVLPE